MESILQLFQLAMIVLPVYGFVSLRKRIRSGELSKRRACLHYAGLIFAPILICVTVYVLMVGVETIMNANLIEQEVARSYPLAIVLGVLVWLLSMLVFVLGLYFVRSVRVAMPPEP